MEPEEIINSYKEKYSYIKIIDNPEKYVSTGFNRALSISKGRLSFELMVMLKLGKTILLTV